jgi:flagellar motility protein MotE (MotC chaperone)
MAIDSEIIAITLSVLAGLASVVVDHYSTRRRTRQTQILTMQKTDRLLDLLKGASSEIEKLEKEVTSKSRKLQEIEETMKSLDSLMSLKEKQVEAVREELKAILKESNRSNRIWTILVGAIWFTLGLIVRGFLSF